MPSGTRQFEAAGIPYDSHESTIFDILRKVLSSKVDRDDARPSDGGQIKSKSLNRKIEILLVLYYRFGDRHAWRPKNRVRTERKK